MPVPFPRNKILPARGNFTQLSDNVGSLLDGEICYAIDQDQYYQNEGGTLVSVGATKAQGALADTALQPGEAATPAQGALADSAIQPGDNISELNNDVGYITLAEIPEDIVTSVNGEVGDVVLDADDISDASTTNKFTTQADIDKLAGIEAGAQVNTVSSVNGQTGAVSLDKTDVGLGNVNNTSDTDKPISTATQAALDNKADLVNGVIPTSQIPSIAITEFLGEVADEAAMLALDGQEGDWCFRSDEGFSYVIVGPDPSQLSDWQQLATPGGDVNSVNGQTGTVVLGASDVGAVPATGGEFSGGIDVNGTVNAYISTDSRGFNVGPDSNTSVARMGRNSDGGGYVNIRDSAGSNGISLSGSTGSGVFSNTVESDDGTDSSSIRPGYMVISPASSSFGQVFGCIPGDVGSYTSKLFADGGAEFAGGDVVIAADGSATFAGTFKKNTSTGALVCGITDDYLRIYDGPQSLEDFEISLEKDGSATFSGDISINNGSYIRIRTTGDNTSTAIQLAPNGSASFDGPISPGNADAGIALVNVSGEVGSCLLGTNKTDINTSRTVNLGAGVQPWNRGYFAGRVQVTNRVEAYAPGDGDYAFSAYGSGSSGASHLFRGATSGGDEVVSILDNGSAFFTSKVASYGDPLATGGAEIGSCMFGGSGFAAAAPGDGFPLFRTYKTGETTPTAQIDSGGSATFSGDISINNGSYIRIRTTGDNTSTAIQLAPNGSASFAGQTSTISSYAQYSFVTTETTSNTGVFVGSSSQTNPTTSNSKMHFAGDGTANIDGRIYVGSPTTTNAFVRVQRSDSGNVFSGNDATSNTSYITDKGKANFGGTSFYTSDTNVQVTDSEGAKLTLSSPGNRTFSLHVNSAGNFSIVDESASENRMTINGSNSTTTFPKTVIAGQNPSGGSLIGVANSFEGYVQATGAVGSTIWYGYEQNGGLTSRIYADGSAEFASGDINLNADGSIVASGSITENSDIKLKENIEAIPDALEKVSQVRGVTFDRVDSGQRQTGVIAQEIEAILPEAVSENAEGVKSVAYGNLVGLLIEAVKELKAEVEAIKAER